MLEISPVPDSPIRQENHPGSGKATRAAKTRLTQKNRPPNEPDAAGRWDPAKRHEVLKHVYNRDGGRCGIWGADTLRLEEAQLEHVVPKVYAHFDIQKGGKIKIGSYYTSLLHELDNLQAAHSYCNKNKGNKKDTRE